MAGAPLRNVAIIGASGRIGTYIHSAISASPAKHNVTVITRDSSSATFDPSTKVVRVGDDYPKAQMEAAFRGQDAVVIALGFAGEHHHSALVKTAAESGVRRVIASGFGCNDDAEALQKIFPTAATKAKMVEELKELQKKTEKDGTDWSWTNICTGLFFDFCVRSGFFGLDPKARTATIWDDGTQLFSAATRPTIGLAVARVLSHPEETANRTVYVSSFETCLNDILAAEQKATGTSPADWAIKHVNTDERIAELTAQMKAATEFMPRMMAMAGLALASNLKPEFEQDFKELGLLDNELLGIEQESVEEVVIKALQV